MIVLFLNAHHLTTCYEGHIFYTTVGTQESEITPDDFPRVGLLPTKRKVDFFLRVFLISN